MNSTLVSEKMKIPFVDLKAQYHSIKSEIDNAIAFEAESMNHHPEMSNIYNRLHIRLSTHDAKGLTEKDFILAQKIEEVMKISYK